MTRDDRRAGDEPRRLRHLSPEVAIGAVLHLRLDLSSGGHLILERLLQGAPLMAPLLFSNMGLVGLVALLPEREHAAAVMTRREKPLF